MFHLQFENFPTTGVTVRQDSLTKPVYLYSHQACHPRHALTDKTLNELGYVIISDIGIHLRYWDALETLEGIWNTEIYKNNCLPLKTLTQFSRRVLYTGYKIETFTEIHYRHPVNRQKKILSDEENTTCMGLRGVVCSMHWRHWDTLEKLGSIRDTVNL